ncbi:MAG: HAD family hydrolase [Bacteroidaceae bacterium]|jgi:phosphoglycolate phosphatase
MKKLIIFDLDGTLVNSIADLACSTNYALKTCGFPEHQTDEYRYFVGSGISVLFERALPADARTEENIQKIRTSFLEHYNLHNTDHSRPYEGMPELLETLVRDGYKMAVASNKYQQATEQIIRKLFPGIPFFPVFGQREGVPRKPDPRIVEEILENTGTSRAETLYVGDSAIDMQTARQAQVTACGVTWGFRPRSELETYEPEYIVDKPAEIYSILKQENHPE